MKILIATDFYTANLGGVTSSVLSLAEGLRSLGHKVKILALSNNNKSHHDKDDYFISSFPAYYAPDMRFTLDLNDPLIDELIAWHPDIIHVQSEGSALTMASKIQRKCHIPLIITCHTDYAYFVFGKYRHFPVLKQITIIASWLVYHNTYRIIVPSKKALDFPFLRIFKNHLLVLPNGIKLEEKKKLSKEEITAIKNNLGIDEKKKIMVAASRLSKEKHLEELISFLPELRKVYPDVLLLIAGDGPDKKHLEDLIRKLNVSDNVIFAGRIAKEEMWRIYAISDIYVSASVFELHSMSLLEAMDEALPLLCHADHSLDNVLLDGYNGYIYTNKTDFVEYAHKLLSNDKIRKQMALNSAIKVQDFSMKNFALRALKIYEDVIESFSKEKQI